jgi:signal transduction histidine kinase
MRRRVVQLALLAIVAVAVGVLTFEAWSALRAHRAATEQAGRAFADVVTRDVHGLATAMFDHEVGTVFLLATRIPAKATPAVAEAFQRIAMHPVSARCDWPCLPGFAERAAVLDLRRGRLVLPRGATIDPALARWIRDTVVADIATEYKPGWQASYLAVPPDILRDHAIIHRVSYDSAGRPLLSLVALMNYRSYGRIVLRKAAESSPMTRLPEKDARTGRIAMRIVDDQGGEWMRSPPVPRPAIHTSTWISDVYFGRFRVELALGDALLDALVGLPRVHLSELLTLFGLTLALILVTGVQWASERRSIELRERFVGDLSHELRTPLQQVRLFAELLALGKIRTAEKRDEAMRIITAQTERTMQLLANLLAMARADRGQLRANLTTVRMESALAPALAGLVPLVTQAGMQLDVGPLTDAWVRADPNALAQVLNNLVENALRHARCGGVVQVSAVARETSVALVVEDRGPGIPPADRTRVWRRFVRLERTESDGESPVPGTGIGLAVVAELVRLQRGRVWVGDAEPRGARFVVELPRVASDETTADVSARLAILPTDTRAASRTL